MTTFSIITIDGTPFAQFGNTAPVDAASLDLPKGVIAVKMDGYDVTLAKADSIPDFLLSPTLQQHGFVDEASAAYMLSQIGVTVDPAAGHSAPTAPTPKPQQSHSAGGFTVTTTPYKAQPYTPPSYRFADSEAIRFHVKTVKTTDGEEVRVGIETLEENRWNDIEDLTYFSDAPSFLLETRLGWACSSLPEAQTLDALLALGWASSAHPFIGYTPQELSFGVLPDDEDTSFSFHDGLCIFVAIKTPHPIYGDCPPFEDDLRPYALTICPEFILGDSMENTFEIDPKMSKNDIIDALVALGYTYDKDIDSYF